MTSFATEVAIAFEATSAFSFSVTASAVAAIVVVAAARLGAILGHVPILATLESIFTKCFCEPPRLLQRHIRRLVGGGIVVAILAFPLLELGPKYHALCSAFNSSVAVGLRCFSMFARSC